MQCPRCLNTDKEFFYKGSKGWYCRKCISFGRAMLQEDSEPLSLQPINDGSEEYNLQYPLTKAQKEISHKCAELIDDTDVLLHCVCGAGKTELVVESISKMLREKKRVCFAIPRRQVVLELKGRLQKYFPHAKVVGVCGGYTKEVDGDLIICTTHQLYRYYQLFDLLILDEPDAYPFKGNEVLHGIAQTSCKGRMIYLTATIDSFLQEKIKNKTIQELSLNVRPHGKPLPVPSVKVSSGLIKVFYLYQWIKRYEDKPRMIFVPTISLANSMHKILSKFMACYVCTSKTENKDDIIRQYRNNPKGLMICTTILERGVTIPNVNICVYNANHAVFDKASLIQIAGRAGRTFKYPEGDVLFLSEERKDKIVESLKEIEEANLCVV